MFYLLWEQQQLILDGNDNSWNWTLVRSSNWGSFWRNRSKGLSKVLVVSDAHGEGWFLLPLQLQCELDIRECAECSTIGMIQECFKSWWCYAHMFHGVPGIHIIATTAFSLSAFSSPCCSMWSFLGLWSDIIFLILDMFKFLASVS